MTKPDPISYIRTCPGNKNIFLACTYVFGFHNVATLAHGRDALVRVDQHCVCRRRYRPRLAISSARVGRDAEFHAIWYANLPRVA